MADILNNFLSSVFPVALMFFLGFWLARRGVFDDAEATAILKLIAEYADDPRENKVDLGVGVYRDENGATPIPTAVKKAEQFLVDDENLRNARLNLVLATQKVLQDGLALLGISAPEEM